jgi:Leucine-rich repeat (LRR) protein
LSNKDLYYKSKGGHIKSIPLHPNTTRVILDYRPLDSIDLKPLRECPMLRELSLKSCILNSIDLTPIENCTEITRLDLSGNRLKEVDLSPIANLTKWTT